MLKTYRMAIAVCACLLLLVGCKYTAFTHEGAVKATTEEFFRYLDKGQWNAAAELMDLSNFEFSFANGVSFPRGYPAKEAYIQSLEAIQGRAGMNCVIHKVKKLKNGNIIVHLSCIVAITENSTTLSFSRGRWTASFLWTKKDAVHWQLRSIHETSFREKGNQT